MITIRHSGFQLGTQLMLVTENSVDGVVHRAEQNFLQTRGRGLSMCLFVVNEKVPGRAVGKYRTALALIVLMMTAVGCGNTVGKAVRESDRDSRGLYDGAWTAYVAKPAKTQNAPGVIFTCTADAYKVNFSVRGGRLQAEGASTWVARNGDFRLEIPREGEAKWRSGTPMHAGQRTTIFQGNLGGSKPSGFVTNGIKQFGNNGCTAKARFQRNNASGT